MSRIHVRYEPLGGNGEVTIDGPSPELALAAEGERRRFLAAAGAAQHEEAR
jgi:hypothetical protein